jgi:CubicO group peptidase (beta-lactamase class C family)
MTCESLLGLLESCTDGVRIHPLLTQWMKYEKRTSEIAPKGKVEEYFNFPLLFEPGTSWQYGASIEWAGVVVMRATNLTLEEYMKADLSAPLGITSATFHHYRDPDAVARVPEMAHRPGDLHPLTFAVANPTEKVIPGGHPFWHEDPADEFGGAGLHISAPDYQKILDGIIADDGRLLKRETIEEMFKPQLSPSAKAAVDQLRLSAPYPDIYQGGLPFRIEHTWGLGGKLSLQDLPGGRRRAACLGTEWPIRCGGPIARVV